MEVIFKKCSSGQLVVYIQCITAVQQFKLDKKLFSHSEYTSKWDELCDEWIEKKYFKYVNKEQLVGYNSIITTLTFIDGRCDELIKALTIYLEDEFEPSGYSEVKYVSFDKI